MGNCNRATNRRRYSIRFQSGIAILLAILGTSGAAYAQVLSGDYTGDGSSSRLEAGLGFLPDVVIIKGNTAQTAVIRTSTMSGDAAKPMTGATALTADLIESFWGGAGYGAFTVGGNARVNSNAIDYNWVAFKQAAKRMKVGSYTGNGGASQAITGVGFSPEFVVVMSAGAAEAVFRSSSDTETFDFALSGGSATLITVLGADGFTLGSNDARVNASSTTYHYIAWNEVPGTIDVGTYTGDGVNDRNVTDPGFKPEYVLIKADTTTNSNAVHHPASLGDTTDTSLYSSANANAADRIEELREDGFQVGTAAEVNTNTVTYNFIAWRRETPDMQVLSGSYTGNNTDNRAITGLGFSPDLVLIKGNNGSEAAIRADARSIDFSKDMKNGTLGNNRIQSLDLQGFTIGTDVRVNATGVTYYWTAWKTGVGQMVVSSYTGNGTVGRQITDLGFSPNVVWIASTAFDEPVYEISASTTAFTFAGAASAGWITALGSDGFTVDANARVNAAGTTYFFVAWDEIAGKMDVGTYTGNGADNRNITGVGFQPEFVYTQSAAAIPPVTHTNAMGAGTDTSNYFDELANANNNIQALQADGFQVGSRANVNGSGQVFVYAAWMRPAVTAVRLVSFSATLDKDTQHTTLHWRTGYEIDNLGFNIYRETTDGQRTRLTKAPVAGSGLVVGPGVAHRAPQRYTWVDAENVDGARYWLEDVDFSGASTWHGPVSPRHARYGESQRDASSVMVPHLGRRSASGPGRALTPAASAERVQGGSKTSNVQARKTEAIPSSTTVVGRSAVPVPAARKAGPSPSTSAEAPEPLSRGDEAFKPIDLDHSHVETATLRGRSGPDSSRARQRAIAAGPAAKLLVRATGWYRVGQPALVAAGLDHRLDPRRLALFVEGVEQAIRVHGEADGRFDSNDFIEFYGTGADTPYSDTRTYWVVEGEGRGRRVRLEDRNATGVVGPSSFPFTVERKERTIFFAALDNGDKENFFGEVIYPEFPTDQTFELVNVDAEASGVGSLEVVLQGVTQLGEGSTDHRVRVQLNGVDLGEIAFSGRDQGEQTFPVNLSLLSEGTNTVTLEAYGGEQDITLVDHIRLTYLRRYVADGISLSFTAEGEQETTIGGFTMPARVVDVTNPAAVREVPTTSTGGSIVFVAPGTGLRRLVAFTDAGALVPASIVQNVPSRYSAGAAGEIVMISHSTFLGSLQPLKAHRERQGRTVTLIDVEDIYDEFSFGEKTPYALKDFLKHAKVTWRVPPRFLLLIGNATTDPRDYYDLGEPDFVPTKTVSMSLLESASDDWFADADDDGFAEMAMVGRLPARTVEQAASMVSKIIGYEREAGGSWNKSVLLVAEQSETQDDDFLAASNRLRQVIPPEFTVQHIDRGQVDIAQAKADVIARINEGQLLVSYVGHGSVDGWKQDLFTGSDAAALTNGARLPFAVMLNCLNGFFNGLYPEESLAEALLRAPAGGAIAVLASSGVTSPRAQGVMMQELYRLMLSGRVRDLGEAVHAAKAIVGDADVRRSYVFFGDPSMRLNGVPYMPLRDDRTGAKRKLADAKPQSSGVPKGTVGATSTADGLSAALSSTPNVTGIRLSDWNRDGRDDVFLHAASGWRTVFSTPQGERVRGGQWSGAWEVHPADMNGDGVEDMVLVDRTTGIMLSAINDGAGSFEYTEGLLGQQWHVHVADLNGDRIDDLLLTMPEYGFWYTMLNDGRGHFTYRAGSWRAASSITLGDFSGDRRADAFIYDPATGAWTLAISDAAGDFSYVSGQSAAGLTVQRANVDSDHRADLLLYNPETGAWAEWASRYSGLDRRSLGEGGFSVRGGLWKPGFTVRAVEGKGGDRDDVLLYDPTSGEWIFAMSQKGPTRYASGVWAPALTIATGDLNADGRTDLVLYDQATGVWIRGLRREAGAFDFTSGKWAQGWMLATRP